MKRSSVGVVNGIGLWRPERLRVIFIDGQTLNPNLKSLPVVIIIFLLDVAARLSTT